MHKNNIGPFIFIFPFLVGYAQFIKTTDNMRDIAIIADVRNKIRGNKPFDILTGELITGIHNEVPILVSHSILNQFIQKRNSFYQKTKHPDSAEHSFYRLYELCNKYLNDMPQKKHIYKSRIEKFYNQTIFQQTNSNWCLVGSNFS